MEPLIDPALIQETIILHYNNWLVTNFHLQQLFEARLICGLPQFPNENSKTVFETNFSTFGKYMLHILEYTYSIEPYYDKRYDKYDRSNYLYSRRDLVKLLDSLTDVSTPDMNSKLKSKVI
jgi:hypothetical protein